MLCGRLSSSKAFQRQLAPHMSSPISVSPFLCLQDSSFYFHIPPLLTKMTNGHRQDTQDLCCTPLPPHQMPRILVRCLLPFACYAFLFWFPLWCPCGKFQSTPPKLPLFPLTVHRADNIGIADF